MADPYEALITALRKHSIVAHFRGDAQLVVSSQTGQVWPDRGNSFWITRTDNAWYLSTWTPVCYRIPNSIDVGDLCIELMTHGQRPMCRAPEELVGKYSLSELTRAERDALFESLE